MRKIIFFSLCLLATQTTEALPCSIAGVPPKYNAEIAYFIAAPTGKTVNAKSLVSIIIPFNKGTRVGLDKINRDTSYAYGDFPTFEAGTLHGNPEVIKSLDSVFKERKSRHVVGVFWNTTASCNPIVQFHRNPKNSVVFTTVIRPKDKWINGMPTFDFHVAKNGIYNPNEPQWKDDFKSVEDFMKRYKDL